MEVATKPAETFKRTYTAVGNAASALTATDIAILPGNATTQVWVTRVEVSGVQTTAGEVDILLIKRATANSGGTSAAMPAVPHDAGDAAAVSVPLIYTANPTPGTTVGTIKRNYHAVAPAASGTVDTPYVWEGGYLGKGIKLMGVAEGLAVNLNGVTVTGGAFSVKFEWREELPF